MYRKSIPCLVGKTSNKPYKPRKPKAAVLAVEPQIEPNQPTIGFSLKLTLGDKSFTSEGTTAVEAFNNLKKPAKIVSKGTLLITKGDQSRSIYMTIPMAKRLFWSPSTREILAKQYVAALK